MSATTSPSDLSDAEAFGFSINLAAAARKNIAFLRTVAESQWLHRKPILIEAIRRYDELWMPLISDLTNGLIAPMFLPPIDVQWIWFCHTLNPASYRQYCESRFSKLIGKPDIFDDENEEYALMRCQEIWTRRYPSEPFENELDTDFQIPSVIYEDLSTQITKLRFLCSKFSELYMSECVYLLAAKQRYKAFLHLLQKFTDRHYSCLVPASDILLMWMTHQSYPTVYAMDMREAEGELEKKVVGLLGSVKEEEKEETKRLWEKTFDEPYEKAGGVFLERSVLSMLSPIHWKVTDTDINTRYKSIVPRFLLEVCVFVRLNAKLKAVPEQVMREFLRFQMVRCHKELKIDKYLSSFNFDGWQKACHLYCEFGTQGIKIELRHCSGLIFKGSSVQYNVVFLWNELLRVSSLSLRREVNQNLQVIASMTPPVQASYLLKCVPDRVTDDSGAMISDVILRLNQYRPQEGRWLSRTVLDHAGRECFVIRIRVAEGFWRRGGETPAAVRWEDRITEVREGCWSYVAGSIGRAPGKVVGTAIPKEPSQHGEASWNFSTGDELIIQWQSSTSISGMNCFLRKEGTTDPSVKLLSGRKLQYLEKQIEPDDKYEESQTEGEKQHMDVDAEEEGFLTLVRFTEENPSGKATALLNWKLLAVELSPEEDAVFALLLCISILRSVSITRKQDVGSLLIRRRLREAKLGSRDWGSVLLHPSSVSSSAYSPHLQPWHWNANAVLASDRADHITKLPAFSYSPAEGGDRLYKQVLIS